MNHTTPYSAPQPVGIYALPAHLLLLPFPATASIDSARGTLGRLLAGDERTELPREWAFYSAALRGEVEKAYKTLEGDSATVIYNRFILKPNLETYGGLVREWRDLPGWNRFLTSAAHFLGISDEEPEPTAHFGVECLALTLSAHASYRQERGDSAGAIISLVKAVGAARPGSPLFAARLLGRLATTRESSGQTVEAVADLKQAIRLADNTPLVVLHAELLWQLGSLLLKGSAENPDAASEASKLLQEGLDLTTKTSAGSTEELSLLRMKLVEAIRTLARSHPELGLNADLRRSDVDDAYHSFSRFMAPSPARIDREGP